MKIERCRETDFGEKVIVNSSPRAGRFTSKKSEKEQVLQLKKYCFTFNNYMGFNYRELERYFKEYGTLFLYGEEIAPTTGTPHLQGFIVLKKAMRITELAKKIPFPIHYITMNGSVENNIVYCSKGKNIVSFGCPKSKEDKRKEYEILAYSQLYPWQRDVYDFIEFEKPDGRTLHWFYDNEGNKGKSELCTMLAFEGKTLCIEGGKYEDVKNIIFNSKMDDIKCVVIDIPRNNGASLSYSAVEDILNRKITNTKYETGNKIFKRVHVIVFSNAVPDETKFSRDRWNFIDMQVYNDIVEKDDVEYYDGWDDYLA